MKATLLQTDIIWGAPEDNLREAEKLICGNCGSDLYVLPEMFTTGFATMEGSAIDDDADRTIKWMQRMAREHNAAIAGSIAMKDGDCTMNRFLFIKPDGGITKYDKHHLFNYGGEGKRFTPGSERVIVDYKGIRFLLLVCYDIRFPVWCRNRDDYDAIIVVASWPDARQEAWDTLTRARAMENQCFVLATNRAGSDPVCNYLGGTVLYNPYGQIVAQAQRGCQSLATGELDMALLESYKVKFPVLEDADKFKML